MYKRIITLQLLLLICITAASHAVETRSANNGNLVMEDIPAIPTATENAVKRYQNVRSAGFRDWSADSQSLFITTRFGDVSQLHRVDQPGGARHQMTFFDEPLGAVQRQPDGQDMLFSMDAGGNEFSQLFMLNHQTGEAELLTDGESRNSSPVWNRAGTHVAFQSTRRNGASNDLWLMAIDQPSSAKMILEAPDGTWWGPADFSADGKHLLIVNYVSINDSRIHLLSLETGELRQLAGSSESASVNLPMGFDSSDKGIWLTTDRFGEFNQLAWQSLQAGSSPEVITENINWDVEGLTLNEQRDRGVFTVNEEGLSSVYLFNPANRRYAKVDHLPEGLAGGLTFSPDNTKLAMVLNTSETPSDTFVMELSTNPLQAGEISRWTYSEVGGLDTSRFISPELVRYPTFDKQADQQRTIPAWIYKPPAKGPHPVIISIHGGPEGQARPGFSSTYQMWLQELNAAVIVPNVRGSSGYGKNYVKLDNGFKREDSVKDIGALLDWIAQQPDLDENRVIVYGGSYGGYMVLASAVKYSDRLVGAVDIVGISNFVTFLENTQDYRRDLRRLEYGDERDPAMRKHLQAISPLNSVEKIQIPMFVVQGNNDPRVPVTEAVQLVAALRQQGDTVWYMNGMNEGHGFRKKENRDMFQQATLLFMQQYLK